MDLRVADVDEAFMRGRLDKSFFWHWFLHRCPHPGQKRFIDNSEATINALACSNRYGKTTLLAGEHIHACAYKTGAESRFLDEGGSFLLNRWRKERYRTVHSAGELDQALEVWEDTESLISNSPRLSAMIAEHPKSLPRKIVFTNGSQWLYRTLGVNASGIDGKNFYLLSIDEAGWMPSLEAMMNNVLRVRVADVRGRIIIVGTFKPGYSADFLKIAVRAAAYTGVNIGFDHRSDVEEESGQLDAAIRRYAEESGFDLAGEIAKLRQEGYH